MESTTSPPPRAVLPSRLLDLTVRERASGGEKRHLNYESLDAVAGLKRGIDQRIGRVPLDRKAEEALGLLKMPVRCDAAASSQDSVHSVNAGWPSRPT